MNRDAELKVQAWLDGELSGAEAAQTERLVQADPEAQVRVRHYRTLKRLLASAEPAVPLPVSREQYWAGLQWQIDRLESRRTPSHPRRLPAWLRLWFPIGATAAVVAALLLNFAPSSPIPRAAYAEIESPLEEISAIIFRSESEQMTVVWLASY